MSTDTNTENVIDLPAQDSAQPAPAAPAAQELSPEHKQQLALINLDVEVFQLRSTVGALKNDLAALRVAYTKLAAEKDALVKASDKRAKKGKE